MLVSAREIIHTPYVVDAINIDIFAPILAIIVGVQKDDKPKFK